MHIYTYIYISIQEHAYLTNLIVVFSSYTVPYSNMAGLKFPKHPM